MLSDAPTPLQGQAIHDLTWFVLLTVIILGSIFLLGPALNAARHLYTSARRRVSALRQLPRLKR
jgi:hypothetical protein